MSGRCDCCNAKLNEYEMTLKHAISGEYIGTCLKCLQDLGIPIYGRNDLNPYDPCDDDLDVLENDEWGEDAN